VLASVVQGVTVNCNTCKQEKGRTTPFKNWCNFKRFNKQLHFAESYTQNEIFERLMSTEFLFLH